MKDINQEEETHFSSKNLLNRIDTAKTEKYIELEDRTPTLNKDSSFRETQTSFDKALIKKIKKEEEEKLLKKQLKENQKIRNQINSLTRKDYIVFFLILTSTGLNYNILFLPFVLISIIYFWIIGKISFKLIKFRYFLEIFTLGYAGYLFLYKTNIYSLIINDNKSITEDNKNYYINFGICALKDLNSNNYFYLNFIPELIMISACIYGILVSFQCRLLKKTDIISKRINGVKLTKYILIIYLFLVEFTVFYFSYLSLLYMLCIQIVFLLNSFKFHSRIMKKILKFVIYFLSIVICIQIILINILNIPVIQEMTENFYSEVEGIAKFFTWKQIGINYDSSENAQNVKFGGYAFGVISLMLLKRTINNLNADLSLEPSIKINPNIPKDNNEDDDIHKIEKIKGRFNKIIACIMQFLSHPTFNFEFTRILSIAWTYHYINIYSCGIMIFIFLSFFSVHIKKNKYLIIFILTPMVIFNLISFHIANISDLFEVPANDDQQKLRNKRLAIGKSKYPDIEYWIGHLYFIMVMFLINSIYTAELRPKNVKPQDDKEIKDNNKKIDEENVNNEQVEEKNEEDKNEEEKNNLEKKEADKKILMYDTQNSINDNSNNSFLLQNDDEKEIENKIKNKIKNKILPKNNKGKIKMSIGVSIGPVSMKLSIGEEYFFSILTLMIRGIFMHIDKITLIVMYLVSIYKVNVIHVILVFILIFQIIAPGSLNGCYKIITLIFQLLYLVEFVIVLLKTNFNDVFKENKKALEFFIVYNEDINSNDIEFFIYAVILCFYFQYRTANIDSIKKIVNNKNLSLKEYVKIKLKNYPNLQNFLILIGNIGLHVYIWALIFAFIFFNCSYEYNLIFGIKLVIFLICCYQFIYLIQSLSRNSSLNCVIIFNRILSFICCLNTLLVYLYQFLCKDFLKINKVIKNNKTNFFVQNLPSIGFTDYEEKDLYYHFLPHFMTTFIAVLYSWQSEEMLLKMQNYLTQRRSTNGKKVAEKIKKKLAEKQRMEKIKEERNEFIQDKLYADKYDENSNELNSKSRSLLKSYIFLFFTDCYWLGLFFSVGIIFSSYDLSVSMLIYVLIFGTLSIIMFSRIIIKLTNYIKNKSYFISKVIRFSIVERPRNREINKKYRVITFRCLLFFSYLYLSLIYVYGIFDFFQQNSNKNSSSDHDDSIEEKIKSLAFLFGIYIDTNNENILNVSLPHLILTCLIIIDLYNQKLADYYSDLTETLTKDIQQLVNENNVLQKYADVADLNILIQIGLSIAGINLSINKNGEDDSRISLLDKFYVPPEEIINVNGIGNNKKGNENNEEEDEDEPLKVDKPKQNISECFNLNVKDPINNFLNNAKIQKFIYMIKNSNENEQQLSLSNSKDRIIRFIKKIIEELIIFISLCLALSKLNMYTFIYIFVTFILIVTKKTMFKYYLLYIFMYLGIIMQSIFFLLNLNIKSCPRTQDSKIYIILKKTMNIPIYKEYYNLTETEGFFYGLGVNRSQVSLIWLEFMQIIIIYFYLNYFSYSIYQDIINLGSSSLSDQKFDFESLNMEEGSLEQIKTMTEYQFFQLKDCLNCFNFNIGNTIEEFFKSLKINKEKSYINYFDTNGKKKSNLNLSEIKNPILKQLIEFRMYEKEYLNTMEKKKKGKYKPLPSYLVILQQILYLYFHCFLLVLIIMLSMMTVGLLSTIYFSMCFYYLIKSDSIYLGLEYSYPKSIKTTLRIIVLIDIIIQGIYQLPFFSMEDNDLRLKIFRAIGLIKVVDISSNNDIDTIQQQLEIFGKALIYFLMSVQNLIYNSKTFKRYYLVYLLENKFQTNKTGLVNAFTFNNNRVKIYERSLSIRQKSVEIMEDLNNIIRELNSKLNKMGEYQISKNVFEIKKSPLEFIKDQRNSENSNINNDIDNQNATKTYLKVEEIKDKIKSMLYDKFITKIYLWFHKNTANYKNIDKDAINDFYIETIKGETKIKSIIESEVNTCLSIIDLTGLEKNDMKDIELLIESQFDKEKKRSLELKKLVEEKAKKNLNKFRKFGNNLLKLNRFAKMIYGQFNAGAFQNQNINNKEGIDILELFRIHTEKERIEKEKKEKELKLKQQKLKYIEELFNTKLFKKYLKVSYQIRHIFLNLRSLFINNFTLVCYFFMILNHMSSASLISLLYPLSIFCFAILEYPRPKKSYWIFILIYTMIIMFIKFIIQLKIILIVISEEKYEALIIKLYYYKIGFKYFESTFSRKFLKYVLFDGLIIFSILINRNLLLTDGLWFKREEEIENIYEASERIAIYRTKNYSNKFEAMQDLLLKYIYTPREVIHIKKNLEKNKDVKNKIKIEKKKYKSIVKHKFPFFGKRNIAPEYNEAQKPYFNKLFTRTRNEKPGNDYYTSYTLVMFLICVYILFFFTKMDQDKTYGSVDMDTTQFSGTMVIFLIFHIIILVYDRVIFASQNRENIEYEYYFYRRNAHNEQGELISEKELNNLRSEILQNDENSKFNKISAKEITRLKEDYNILFIQKEQFNKPLLNKYILHIFTTIFSHAVIFFYFPIKGNSNLGIGIYCEEGSNKSCNNFGSNIFIIFFYIFYLFYLFLSGLQIRFGFYDIKRKSLFKKKDDEMYSNLGSLFQVIPFLNEIKNAIDWTFTSTCFNLIQWNKFEAIYDTIFDTYCEKSDWDEKPVGERISRKQKIMIGGSLAFILILILTVPLILFSSLNPTNELNNLTGAKITVDLTFNYENGAIKKYNIFENTRADSISEIDSIWEYYNYSESVQTRNFKKEQVQRVIFSETSDKNWDLAVPHINNLINELNLENNNALSSIELNIDYELTRPLPAEAQTCSNSFVKEIYSKGDDYNNSFIETIRIALKNCTDTSDILDEVYCPPLRLTSGSSDVNEIEDEKFFNKRGLKIGFEGCVKENNNINYFNSFFTIKSYYKGKEEPLELHVFSDKISETTSGYSVITFYVSFVLLAGSYIREFLENEPEKIMLEELPHPKKIVELCEGIKIARYSYDFKTEEYLYTVLIELLRSPDYLKIITDSSLDHFSLREEMNNDNDDDN